MIVFLDATDMIKLQNELTFTETLLSFSRFLIFNHSNYFIGLERLNPKKDSAKLSNVLHQGLKKTRQGDIIPLSELKKVKNQMEENPVDKS